MKYWKRYLALVIIGALVVFAAQVNKVEVWSRGPYGQLTLLAISTSREHAWGFWLWQWLPSDRFVFVRNHCPGVGEWRGSPDPDFMPDVIQRSVSFDCAVGGFWFSWTHTVYDVPDRPPFYSAPNPQVDDK